MRLRTTAGAYAGEIRDYPFSVAQAALKVGSAEIVADDPAPDQPAAMPVVATMTTTPRPRRAPRQNART